MDPNARDTFYRERDAISSALARGENPYGGQQNALNSIYNTYGRNSGVSYQEVGGILGEAYKQPTQQTSPKADPYAKWGGRAGLNEAKQNIYSNFNAGGDKMAFDYRTGVEDTVRGLRDNQNALNMRGAQNELAKMQGRQGVLGMVNRGINSTGVMMGNRNAGDSSAAQTLANVYGSMGTQEMNKIGNQYAMQNEELARLQSTQDEDMASKTARLRENKDIMVNDLVNKARASLAALNAEMANAAVPDRIALEQESARIKNELLGRLQQFDGQLASAPSNIRANSSEARMAEAQRLAQAGKSADNPFQFQQIDTQAQSGPFSGNLPLFTDRNRRGN